MQFDTIIHNIRVVRPNRTTIDSLDIGIKNGKISTLEPSIDRTLGKTIIDGENRLAFPGVVDAHMHTGIYTHLKDDAITESRAAAMGGVTTSINYMRTGQYYLNKSGPYRDFFPEVLAISKGKFHVDYAYHLAPMMGSHIDEIEYIIDEFGVSSFKIFMFYGSHGLHGKSDDQSNFLMIGPDDKYDMAHFEFIMRGIQKAMDKYPDKKDMISLSLHCETAEIMTAYTQLVEKEGKLSGLPAYSASRPPHSEGLAIFIASYLAHETNCVNINLLHLSSRKALDAAMMMQNVFPHINFKREVTVGHLLMDIDCPNGNFAKVNPPIRPRADVEALWESLKNGHIDWVVSDHACCSKEMKVDSDNPENVFLAKSGFGGTEYLLSGLFSEGTKRGVSENKIAELLCWNPAQRFGLPSKGDIAPGFDADIVLLDPDETFIVKSAESESTQGYSPFEGFELKGKVKTTFLRGNKIFEDGQILGQALGRYLKRPY
ncbi:MAG: dihydroorotase family protein [Candidatus Marinimicrobia bacterium]|jgi:allantoinase|nr:dihydroorotase family protein [Candidatus Neomarinimicrobiota bacterium]MBT3497206.1 dihydroorotase family protein [Candidatus Neomarinimicrobiota bacterium]MBT3692076.1 dihydroorotase family protein [Candidatus Neomarinimicrobiota bacterium]MBT3732272.1 dihydroorotase family protein [Candidatus Neomarinimicrobiota bacterium]MBT4143683.1 dihydroorotase family protein [Candidatus Neomarinimicrobiota bacterium]